MLMDVTTLRGKALKPKLSMFCALPQHIFTKNWIILMFLSMLPFNAILSFSNNLLQGIILFFKNMRLPTKHAHFRFRVHFPFNKYRNDDT